MSDRLGQARGLGHAVEAGWQHEDVEAQLARLQRRRRVRTGRRIVAVPLTLAAIAAGLFAVVSAWSRPELVALPALPIVPHHAPVAPRPPAPEPAIAPQPPEHHANKPPVVHEKVVRPSAPPAPAEPATTWRDAAARGDYAAAWHDFAPPLDTMPDLLLAGDVARLSGHPQAAVEPLGRAIALHADDPRAPLAAFTLGRVHLEDLGAPRDAALAFARARELAPDGPLAEDALAREVEAWSRAGETDVARARAQSYLEHYPHGRRAHAVRKFGGLEGP